jgi:hypothetical protein
MFKTLGFGLVAGLAIPLAGLSGLASVGLIFVMLISERNRNPDIYGYLALSIAFLILALWLLRSLQKKAESLVNLINQREGLLLDKENLLGYPSPAFIVFDAKHQKLAVCNLATGDYQIHDFSWVIRWYMTWREVDSVEMNGGFRVVNSTGVGVPTFEARTRYKDFAMVLEVNNPRQPVMRFPMSKRAVEKWCSRLSMLFHY